MKILFKYTSRSRVTQFKRGLESILNNVSNNNYHILITIDEDDEALVKYCEKLQRSDITVCIGKSKNKVEAINRDVEQVKEWDVLVNMSDDMIFTVKNFDTIIRDSFDKTCQCLHFPDGNRSDLITMSIFTKEYYDMFGYIYHPDYISLYCDNEQTEVAKTLGAYKYIDTQIFEHRHPAYGKAQMDSQYIYTESFGGVDNNTYLRRKSINYGL